MLERLLESTPENWRMRINVNRSPWPYGYSLTIWTLSKCRKCNHPCVRNTSLKKSQNSFQ
jgi:hypothetical protein